MEIKYQDEDKNYWDNIPIETGERGPLHWERLKISKSLLKNFNGSLLDIGCGLGDISLFYAKKNADNRVIGVELDRNVSLHLQGILQTERVSNMKVMNKDFLIISLEEPFDIVMCSEVLEHVKDDISALKKINTFLKVGGYLIISVPYSMKLYGVNDKDHCHFRRYKKNELINKLQTCGFRIEKLMFWGFPMGWLYYYLFKRHRSFSIQDRSRMTYLKLCDILLPLIKGIFYIDIFLKSQISGVGLIVIAKKVKESSLKPEVI